MSKRKNRRSISEKSNPNVPKQKSENAPLSVQNNISESSSGKLSVGNEKNPTTERITTRNYKMSFFRWIFQNTNHQVIGGIIAAAIIGLMSVLYNHFSPMIFSDWKQKLPIFCQSRKVLLDYRCLLEKYAEYFYQYHTDLKKKYPQAQFLSLIVKDPFWLRMESMMDANEVKLEFYPHDSQFNPHEFQLDSFPFTYSNGYRKDCWGYASNLEELNAPRMRYDSAGNEIPETKIGYETEHIQAANDVGKKIYNGSLFLVRDIITDKNEIRIIVGKGNYYDFTDSCEMLAYETAERVFLSKAFLGFEKMLAMKNINWKKVDQAIVPLKQRERLWDIFNFNQRSVGIGICTLVVRLQQTTSGDLPNNLFYLHNRKVGTASEAMNAKHVVPAGSLAPAGYVDSKNFKIVYGKLQNSVIHEFLEEYLGINLDEKIRLNPNNFEDCCLEVKDICNKFRSGQWKLYYIGMGMDPLNGKIEVACCLVIRASKEDTILDRIDTNIKNEGEIDAIPFTLNSLQEYNENKGKYHLFPTASLCLEWAQKHYREILSIQ